MNINDLVSHYVAFRRALGERFKTNESLLRAFCRAVGPQMPITRVRLKNVMTFLNGTGPTTRAWHAKYFALKGFFRFAVSRGDLRKAPLPTEVPKKPPALVPYIYSREEIRRLLQATTATQREPALMEPPTMRAILLVMYGAALRNGEVLGLSSADVDLANSLLTIRNTKFFKSRLVPIGHDLTNALLEYASWRQDVHPGADVEGTFFVGRHGEAIHRCTLDNAFKRLREHAGVRRSDGGRFQPRMHDLRHTFAVHRLTEWYRQGADVQRFVHHLSVYLGHAHLSDTQVYLTMTPEVLHQTGSLFERYACEEDNHA
jgi:integrase/recombinase XerD